MSDGNDTNRADGADKLSRRGFLRGEFLNPFRGRAESDGSSADRKEREERDAPNEESDPGPEEATRENEPRDLPPESRGPAVDLDAILDRAESIAGVSDDQNETPHPHYQNTDASPDEEPSHD